MSENEPQITWEAIKSKANFADLREMPSPMSEVILLSGLDWGECYNGTSRNIAIFGPKLPRDNGRFDNGLWFLKPGQRSPQNWDCDGIFVPNDMTVVDFSPSGMGRAWTGPIAVKISNGNELITRTAPGNVIEINIPPTDLYRPGQANWDIRDISQSVVDSWG